MTPGALVNRSIARPVVAEYSLAASCGLWDTKWPSAGWVGPGDVLPAEYIVSLQTSLQSLTECNLPHLDHTGMSESSQPDMHSLCSLLTCFSSKMRLRARTARRRRIFWCDERPPAPSDRTARSLSRTHLAGGGWAPKPAEARRLIYTDQVLPLRSCRTSHALT